MAYIIKVHGRNEQTEEIMKLLLKLAEENDFIDVFSEEGNNSELLPSIEERLNYLSQTNIEQLKSLAKCELIRRKIEYKRISKFPPASSYKNIADRTSLFALDLE